MIELKEGCVIAGNAYINAILHALQIVFARHDWPVIITSGRDSIHGANSYHAKDRALDVRCWMIIEGQREAIAEEIRKQLPKFYDVVYEPAIIDSQGKMIKGAHFHIEADEKKEHAV